MKGSKDGDPFERVRTRSRAVRASRASRHKPSIEGGRFEDIPETEGDQEDDDRIEIKENTQNPAFSYHETESNKPRTKSKATEPLNVRQSKDMTIARGLSIADSFELDDTPDHKGSIVSSKVSKKKQEPKLSNKERLQSVLDEVQYKAKQRTTTVQKAKVKRSKSNEDLLKGDPILTDDELD